jgi:hypothetical protein
MMLASGTKLGSKSALPCSVRRCPIQCCPALAIAYFFFDSFLFYPKSTAKEYTESCAMAELVVAMTIISFGATPLLLNGFQPAFAAAQGHLVRSLDLDTPFAAFCPSFSMCLNWGGHVHHTACCPALNPYRDAGMQHSFTACALI